jgi:ribonucleoside-triphosphate reductase (formate)
MSIQHRTRGVRVLKAVSSPLRLQILNFLFDKNALSYTELMSALKMNPSRDAGRFAYHLKFLLKANLVEADVDTKKYYLTDLGKMLIDIADRVEKNAQKTKAMIVRTSHSTLEEFDPNKIAHSLIREAKMPPEEAQKTAKEAEKLLQKSRTKYVTAPLIREIVNALLIEKGQEDYRHKLTRLGLPVHEVTALIENRDNPQNPATIMTKAGQAVFTEYVLLNIFPRDVADAHTSGAIHINHLSTWLLRPSEVIHDFRFFLQRGLLATNSLQLPQKPPETFDQALSLAFNVLLRSAKEVDTLQTLAHFNLFLAPYARNTDPARIREALSFFIQNLNQSVDAAISLTLNIPQYIADKPAIGPLGKPAGIYADFAQETSLIASLFVDIVGEESNLRPLLNPRLILRITKKTLADEKSREILQKAHKIAAEHGIFYFANMGDERNAIFSATGAKFETDLTGDWETDTLRTGCLGTVTINLPRIAYESEKEPGRFFDILKERYDLATRALEIKSRTLKQHERIVLPFLTQSGNGDRYLRLENCSNLINFAGIQEASEMFCAQNAAHPDIAAFRWEISKNINNLKAKPGRRHGKRFFSTLRQSLEASERQALLDIEKFGVARMRFSGTREKPYYQTVKRLRLHLGVPLTIEPESIKAAQDLSVLNQGGNLSVIELGQSDTKQEELSSLTATLLEAQTVELFTYNHAITFCNNCMKRWLGTLQKCPQCGAISSLTIYDRFASS